MVAFIYAIPLIACLLLRFEFDYDGRWTTYLWVFLFGELTAGLLHGVFYSIHTSSTEYLGSLVKHIMHEEEWIELIKRTETKTDSNGKSYTVTHIEEKRHPEKYYFHTTLNSEIDTDKDFFRYVRNVWGLSGGEVSWTGKNIKGGIRYGTEFYMNELDLDEQKNPERWVPVSESHEYINKIRVSNSIFKFEKIEKKDAQEAGLYDYPQIIRYDAPCILSHKYQVPEEIDDMFRKFNAVYAPKSEMRLYVLLFDADSGIGISELQRAYWQGGNKNEFIVCIGMKPDNEIGWARAFSWADEQTKEVETAQWLMRQKKLDWKEFHDWMREHITNWERKQFKDFDYINVTLPMWQILTMMILSIGENALALYIAL